MNPYLDCLVKLINCIIPIATDQDTDFSGFVSPTPRMIEALWPVVKDLKTDIFSDSKLNSKDPISSTANARENMKKISDKSLELIVIRYHQEQ